VVGYAVAYLDNIMFLMKSTSLRNECVAKFKYLCSTAPGQANAVIKIENGSAVTIWDNKEVEFLGVKFLIAENTVSWRHANVEKWASLCPETRMARRQIAEIVGTVIWHWTLSGLQLRAIKDVLHIASSQGKACHTRQDWDTVVNISDEEVETLQRRLRELREAGRVWQTYYGFAEFGTGFDCIKLAASDASDIKGAFVEFTHVPTRFFFANSRSDGFLRFLESPQDPRKICSWESWDWTEEERLLSINRKEVWAVIKVIRATLLRKMDVERQLWLLVVAIDNTTASCAFRNWSFPADETLDAVIDELHDVCATVNLTIMPVQVKSEEEVADDPSRGKTPTWDRCKKTLECLFSASRASELVFKRHAEAKAQ